jgi:hypothetical protein
VQSAASAASERGSDKVRPQDRLLVEAAALVLVEDLLSVDIAPARQLAGASAYPLFEKDGSALLNTRREA